jgi:hypothetical protein
MAYLILDRLPKFEFEIPQSKVTLYPPTLIFNILNLPSSFDIEEYFDPVGV